ncbi:MAG: flagellar biosynthesis repressor FlbT [Pseudomonadota bacterium]
MSGLTLTLKPREKFLVGGNLVENGPRRSSIRISDEAVYVLRLSDALHPQQINSPVSRAYHAAQMILACEVTPGEGQPELLSRLGQLAEIFGKTPHLELMRRICSCAVTGRYYGVLVGLKSLLDIEAEMLATVEKHPPEGAHCTAMGRR